MNPTDPLSQLRDIHLPEAVGWWPPAIGWWLLALLLISIVCGSIYWMIWRHRRLAYKREAIAHMESIRARYLSSRDDAKLLSELSSLLKRTAITRYGRDEIAGMAGNQWLAFLDSTGQTSEFSEGSGRVLAERFTPSPRIDSTELLNAVDQWLKKQS
ncbi:DUF4381 domain-containing protein [Ketobacter alkanivorans]|uniref:DUF4381 domain-containing protein n=1 Tax=Ketobacter alkanivorans TaxID=1917421 RepID=A0A2K9LGX1_9GAMM|nr:DUF4381 domain-containing protein [Ketobacter alkanivorans]AUM11493.1 hypothetical protein Kalk_03225 [Ketobacter alkanivorans]MCP5019567.1 DUF4381 domain-containing protein [Ketobacter sp.]